MYLEQFFIEGLGCASYLIGCEGAGMVLVLGMRDKSVIPMRPDLA
jgi:hypothetical protein